MINVFVAVEVLRGINQAVQIANGIKDLFDTTDVLVLRKLEALDAKLTEVLNGQAAILAEIQALPGVIRSLLNARAIADRMGEAQGQLAVVRVISEQVRKTSANSQWEAEITGRLRATATALQVLISRIAAEGFMAHPAAVVAVGALGLCYGEIRLLTRDPDDLSRLETEITIVRASVSRVFKPWNNPEITGSLPDAIATSGKERTRLQSAVENHKRRIVLKEWDDDTSYSDGETWCRRKDRVSRVLLIEGNAAGGIAEAFTDRYVEERKRGQEECRRIFNDRLIDRNLLTLKVEPERWDALERLSDALEGNHSGLASQAFAGSVTPRSPIDPVTVSLEATRQEALRTAALVAALGVIQEGLTTFFSAVSPKGTGLGAAAGVTG